METCLTCKYWFERKDLATNNIKIGDCLKLCDLDLLLSKSIIPKLEEEDSTGIINNAGFLTGENFCCIHYEH